MKIELREEHDGKPKGSIIEVVEVINNDKNRLPKTYKCKSENNLHFDIPAYKCSEIYEKETDPEKIKYLDDWFDNVTEKISSEPKPIVKEIELKLTHEGELKKSIKFKLNGFDIITLDDMIDQKEKLNSFFEEKENKAKNDGNYDYYGGNYTPNINFNSNTLTLSFGEESYSEIRNRYWKWALKYFGLKEDEGNPKLKKLKSVERYGICRFPDYYDMFYIETNARKELVEEYYSGNVKKLVTKLKKGGFKVKITNIDYIISYEPDEIIKTNKLEV